MTDSNPECKPHSTNYSIKDVLNMDESFQKLTSEAFLMKNSSSLELGTSERFLTKTVEIKRTQLNNLVAFEVSDFQLQNRNYIK